MKSFDYDVEPEPQEDYAEDATCLACGDEGIINGTKCTICKGTR